MHRRYLCVSLFVLLVVTPSAFVNGFPQAVKRLQEVQHYVTKRVKRGAVDFHKAIRCYQPTTNVLGSYGSYGCFCGFSGVGQPLDETDRCCEIHDKCYAVAGALEKNWWDCVVSVTGNLLASYTYNCKDGVITCGADTPYRRKLCECDKAAAECFYYASATYHPQLLHVDSTRYCSGNSNHHELNLSDYENRYVPKTNEVQVTILAPDSSSNATLKEENKKTTASKRKEEKDVVIPHLVTPQETKSNSKSNYSDTDRSSDVALDVSRKHRHRHHNFTKATGKKNESTSTNIERKSGNESKSSKELDQETIQEHKSSTRSPTESDSTNLSRDEPHHNTSADDESFTSQDNDRFYDSLTTKPVATSSDSALDASKLEIKNSKKESETKDTSSKGSKQKESNKHKSSLGAFGSKSKFANVQTTKNTETQNMKVAPTNSTLKQEKSNHDFVSHGKQNSINLSEANVTLNKSHSSTEERNNVDGVSTSDVDSNSKNFDHKAGLRSAYRSSANSSSEKSSKKKSVDSNAPPSGSPGGGSSSCHRITIANFFLTIFFSTSFLFF